MSNVISGKRLESVTLQRRLKDILLDYAQPGETLRARRASYAKRTPLFCHSLPAAQAC